MPHPTFEKIDPEKKKKLLEAAMKEFGTHGYELSSINRILEAAQFSKSSFYYYFEDKLDLAATTFIVCAEPETLLPTLELPETQEEFWAVLRRNSMERLKNLESKRLEYQCLIRVANAMMSEPQLQARIMPLFAPGRVKMMAFWEKGVALGAVRADLPVATQMALMEAVKTAAYKSLYPGDRVPTEAEMESFTDFILDLGRRICAPPKG